MECLEYCFKGAARCACASRASMCVRGLDAHRSSIHPPWRRVGILTVAVCLCATVADAFLSGASLGRIAPVIRAEQSTRSDKSAVTMQFKVPEFKMPQFNAPQFPTAGGGASVKIVAVSGEMPTAEDSR